MPKSDIELFSDTKLRELINEAIAENEKPGDTRICKRCQITKILDDFHIKRSYNDKKNVFWLYRESNCKECSQEVKRTRKPKKLHWSDRFLKRVPYVAALRLMIAKPEVLALVIQHFRADFEEYYTLEHEKVHKSIQKEMEARAESMKRLHSGNQYALGNRGRGDSIKVRQDAEIRYGTGKARLTFSQVKDARLQHEFDGKSVAVLAKEYGVTNDTMRDLLTRRSWANVE